MRFAVGVTLYNPHKEQIDNIALLAENFDKVFLFDNSEPDYIKPNYPSSDKFEILSYNENVGLSKAFNCIMDHCNDFDFLCTMDQDSKFYADDIHQIQSYIKNTDTTSMGIIAPYIDYGSGKHQQKKTIESKSWVITSGSFVNLNVVRKFNLKYDEKYFIDKFEIDMCEQIKQVGGCIIMYHKSVLHQELGEKSGHKHPNHSPLRHYYLFRNRFYFNNKWHSGICGILLSILQTVRHLCLIVMYEKNKIKKTKVLLDAYFDYKHNKLGKKS